MINFRALILFFSAILLATSVAGDGECAAGSVLCPEGLCCSKWGFCGNTDAYCSCENCQSQCSGCPPPAPPAVDVSDIITESVFDQLIPNRDFITCPARGLYTYEAFLTAARYFPEFGNVGNIETRTRELAAFFAQTSTKTTGGTPGPDEYEWGYCYNEEPSTHRCAPTDKWPCDPNQSYHPRGPIGLECCYNYEEAGAALEYNLTNKPDMVSHEPNVTFKTAIWYWMNSHYTGVPSCHSVMVGTWIPSDVDKKAGRLPGYGVTINALFPYECGSEQEDYNVVHSINYYNRSTTILNVSPGENVHCNKQQPFPISNLNNLGNVLKMPIYKA